MATVNTRDPKVDIPPFLREKESVSFILGVNPTPRLQADGKGILVEMKFGGAPHTCFFPWESIERLECKGSVIQFIPDMDEILRDKTEKTEPAKKKRPNLRLVR